jgi:uncharacterized membrane protein YphA (DoxX/SURF4 family)
MRKSRHVHFMLGLGVILSLALASSVFADNSDNARNDDGSGVFKFIVLAIVGIGIYRLQTRNNRK